MAFWPVVKRVLDNCDLVLIVRDARVPDLSRNEELETKLREGSKEVWEVFSKCDLISKTDRAYLEKRYQNAIFVASIKRKGIWALREKLQQKAATMIRELRVGVVGYPNMGKSALINALAGQHKAKVSSVAGTTKGSQWIRMQENILIIDTPGVIPFFKREDELVLLAAKNPERVKDVERAALVIVRYLLKNRPDSIKRYANAKEIPHDIEEVLELIGKNKHFLMKGGVTDTKRTATTIIRDWQSGKIR